MNKYQEALNKIKNIGEKDLYNERNILWANTLQELVDKETPMKVIIQERVLDTDYYCPKCNGELLYGEQKYCDMCGQRLYLVESDIDAKD